MDNFDTGALIVGLTLTLGGLVILLVAAAHDNWNVVFIGAVILMLGSGLARAALRGGK